MSDLRTLMRQAVETTESAAASHAGLADLPASTVLAAARSRVRARNSVIAAVACGLVVACVIGTAVAVRSHRDAEPVDGIDLGIGPVLPLDDAVTALPGEDYQDRYEYTSLNHNRVDDRIFVAYAGDGLLFSLRGEADSANDPLSVGVVGFSQGEIEG